MLKNKGVDTEIIDFPNESNAADLNHTVSAANCSKNASLGISLHSDCSDNASACGGHVCYYSATGKKIADCIAPYLCSLLPGRASKTVKRDNLYVLKKTAAPWVLVEGGFISNTHDALLMKYYPEAIADAYFKGIMDYLYNN